MKTNQKLQIEDFKNNLNFTNGYPIINSERIIRSLVNQKKQRQRKQGGNVWNIISENEDIIEIESQGKGNKFSNIVPKEFTLDPVFLGLWIGDGLTSIDKRSKIIKHIGFGNNDIENIKYFVDYLKSLNQDINKCDIRIQYGNLVLESRIKDLKENLIKVGLNKIKFKPNKTNNLSEGANGLTAIIRLANTPLSTILTKVFENFDFILRKSSKEFKFRFLAGFFSAEGTADKRSNKLQWGMTDQKEINLVLNIIKDLNFKNPKFYINFVSIGYNRSNRESDFNIFSKNILTFIPSHKKKEEVEGLIKGNRIREHDILYFSSFLLFPNLTINRFANCFRIHPSNASATAAEFVKQKLLSRDGTGQGSDPFLHLPTEKGLRWFKENFDSFRDITQELDRLGHYKKCFKKENIEIFNTLKKL